MGKNAKKEKENYESEKILKRCENALKENVSDFYNIPPLNYTGKTTDTKPRLFNEVIAEYLTKNISEFDRIPQIRRENSYIVNGHKGEQDGNQPKEKNENRQEEHIALRMYDKEYDCIGKIVDYQVPLKDYTTENNEVKVGKIDMLSVKGDKIYIIELKKPNTTETLLRCILEGYTYYKRLDKGKLINDMKEKGKLNKEIDNYKFVIAPLFFKGDENQPYKEVKEKEKRKALFEFIKELKKHEKEYEKDKANQYFYGVELYCLDGEGPNYTCLSIK